MALAALCCRGCRIGLFCQLRQHHNCIAGTSTIAGAASHRLGGITPGGDGIGDGFSYRQYYV